MRRIIFKIESSTSFILILVLSVLLFLTAQSKAQQTIHGCIPGVITKLGLRPVESLDPDIEIGFLIGLPLRNEAKLDSLLQGPHPAQTPAQFTAEFGPTKEDFQSVIVYAKQNGFTITQTPSNRLYVGVKAKVGDVDKAFHIKLLVYNRPDIRGVFYAPDRDPTLDLKTSVDAIEGLNNYGITLPVGGSPGPVLESIKPNYPNPFNPTTTIRYRLSRMAIVRVRVYNILGQQVAKLVDGVQFGGGHEVTFNASQLTSGVYIYSIQIGDKVWTRKMLLMK